MKKFDKLFKELEDMASGANTSCKDFTVLLKKLGFDIEDCESGGHKVAKHSSIKLLEYPDYNCGHNPGTHVKRVYVNKLYKFVKNYKDVIKEHIK